jgi:hypothetical protein
MRRSIFVLIFAGGCNLLFPELDNSSSSSDLTSTAADGSTPEIQGQLCVLGDVRDPRTCATGVPSGMHVDVEETRDSAPVDSTGAFTLPLSQALSTATLAAADPSGTYSPTVMTVTLENGRLSGLAVPVVQAQLVASLERSAGVAPESGRGVFFGWAVDAQGNAQSGAIATLNGAVGPFYEGDSVDQISVGPSTGTHGLVTFFNVPGGSVELDLLHPNGASNAFALPIRANAVTLSLLIP